MNTGNYLDGAYLTYYVSTEAWWRQHVDDPDLDPHIAIAASYPDGGNRWHFRIEQIVPIDDPIEKPALRLVMYGDAFKAFREAPGVFMALRGADRLTELSQVVELLRLLGAVDITPRVYEPPSPR